MEANVDPSAPLDAVAFDHYLRLLRGVTQAGYPHLLRVWNYVPRIHDRSSGIERYMAFCKGRSEAFAAHLGEAFPDRLSAASAVGCPGDVLVVHALASREPGRHVENPRQLAAYRYPERYGPKSPSFARGTVAPPAWGGVVFVSGTASIVGHESLFRGDPARQAAETMRNIEAVLDGAGVPGGRPLGRRLRSLRVYVRFPAQLDAIRVAVTAASGTAVPTAWLQAEICREELLVEIEATARG
jgi:enamine deaminase RidA (YjgF/YER057c/UK114 family)